MRYKGLNLNLLVALDALLSECSVTAAADSIFLSQSAMSGALNQLREYFNDELLVMSGRRLVRTPRGDQLSISVHDVLLQIKATIAASPDFDPRGCTRRFVIEASDFVSEVLVAPVAVALTAIAPNVVIEVLPRQQSPETALDSGEMDLVITPDSYASPNHPSEVLFEEEHVIAGWRENPYIGPGFSEEDFYQLGHVAVRLEKGRRLAFAEGHLRDAKRQRRVEVSVPAFKDVPRFLIGTQRVALLQRRLAQRFESRFDLAIAPVPFALPRLIEVIQYHRVRAGDKALDWLCGLFREAAALDTTDGLELARTLMRRHTQDQRSYELIPI